jgi:preprotein translocase subunit SecD
MKRRIGVRLAIIAATIIVSVILCLPSTPLYSSMPGWWKHYLPSQGVTLGLDLLGGMHVVLHVESEKAVEGIIDRTLATLPSALTDLKLTGVTAKRTGPLEMEINFTGQDTDEATGKLKDSLVKLMEDSYPTLNNTDREIPKEKRWRQSATASINSASPNR